MPSLRIDHSTGVPVRSRRRWRWVALVVFLGALTQCLSNSPRHGWQERRWGPVVSHETFPADCALCHYPETWDRLKPDFAFDHEGQTGFALSGAHEHAACLRCHNDRGPASAYAARGCGGCHPDPHQAKLGPDCEKCHHVDDWGPRGLIADHFATRFPLFGVHAATPCELCHERAPTGDYGGAPTRCDVCHAGDVAAARTLDHLGAGLTTGCERCHTPAGWEDATVPHDSFALIGGHSGLACSDCHSGGVFSGLATDCFACHQDDYGTAPNHVLQGYPLSCESCHTPLSWGAASIIHDAFPLTAGHAGLACQECHRPGTFQGLSSTCFSCHMADYAAAPSHSAVPFPTQCEVCHTTSGWHRAVIDHGFFPLVGAHAPLACSQCHTGGGFTGLESECYSCHSIDYAGARDHASLNLSTQCEMCHTATRWGASTFQHDFPLEDDHDVACTQCHTSGTATVFNCLSCHPPGKTNEEHEDVGGYTYVSTACYSCHPDGRD